MCRLVLLPPEKDLLSAEENVALKKIQLDVAKANAIRAEQLLNDKAGSIKQVEQAKADLAAADADLKVAQARLDILKGINLNAAAKNLSSLNIESPIDGIIQKVYVAPGQTVSGGTNLMEITGIDPVWIRVPVYVGNLTVIDDQKPAMVYSLSEHPLLQRIQAIHQRTFTTNYRIQISNSDPVKK